MQEIKQILKTKFSEISNEEGWRVEFKNRCVVKQIELNSMNPMFANCI